MGAGVLCICWFFDYQLEKDPTVNQPLIKQDIARALSNWLPCYPSNDPAILQPITQPGLLHPSILLLTWVISDGCGATEAGGWDRCGRVHTRPHLPPNSNTPLEHLKISTKTLSDEVLGWSDKSPRTGQTETLIKCWIHRISTIFGSTSPHCLFLVRQRFAMLVEANLTPVPSNALDISKKTLKPVFVTLSFTNSGKSESECRNVSKWHNRDFVSWHSGELNHWHFWWIVKKQPILSQEGNI